MKERRVHVRTYLVHWVCDKCGLGDMKPTGTMLASYPPQYPHVCDRCGYQDSVRGKTYPYTEHEEINPLTLEDHHEEL